jgi:hypothetical protein
MPKPKDRRSTPLTGVKALPGWAVVGTEDRVIPPETQRRMAERAGATITQVAGPTFPWSRTPRSRSTRSSPPRATDPGPAFDSSEGVFFGVPRGDQSVATPQEREQQRKQQRKTEFDRQVDNGTLVVRQMTAEERVKYAESPEAAAEREARRARKRN